MTRPVDIYIEPTYSFENGEEYVSLTLSAAIPGYNEFIKQVHSGIGVNRSPADEVNELFANIEDAIDHYKDNDASLIIAQINDFTGKGYVLRDFILVKPEVNEADKALKALINGKNPLITAGTHISDAATNAATNSATNYNLLSGILGVANGLNDANTAQNDLATKYNALATKFNTLMDRLEAAGILAAS